MSDAEHDVEHRIDTHLAQQPRLSLFYGPPTLEEEAGEWEDSSPAPMPRSELRGSIERRLIPLNIRHLTLEAFGELIAALDATARDYQALRDEPTGIYERGEARERLVMRLADLWRKLGKHASAANFPEPDKASPFVSFVLAVERQIPEAERPPFHSLQGTSKALRRVLDKQKAIRRVLKIRAALSPT
jgi:hypothetical protein